MIRWPRLGQNDQLQRVAEHLRVSGQAVKVALFHERQQLIEATPILVRRQGRYAAAHAAGSPKQFAPVREHSQDIVMIVNRQPPLLQVVGALGASCCLADFLHRWQQQADQDGDDRNDDQQFDECETA
jgi:hypothetical protein